MNKNRQFTGLPRNGTVRNLHYIEQSPACNRKHGTFQCSATQILEFQQPCRCRSSFRNLKTEYKRFRDSCLNFLFADRISLLIVQRQNTILFLRLQNTRYGIDTCINRFGGKFVKNCGCSGLSGKNEGSPAVSLRKIRHNARPCHQ